MQNQTRNYGLDIFRIISMVMITFLHVNNQALHLMGHSSFAVKASGYLIEYACFCGVNCFALLTGYLASKKTISYDKKWFGRLFDIYVKSVIFGLIIYLLFVLISKTSDFSVKNLLSLFLIRDGSLWYIRAYLGLLLLLPIISGIVSRFSARDLTVYSFFSFVLVSVLSVRGINRDFMVLAGGYSTLWLIICFTWGQVLKRFSERILQGKYSTPLLLGGVVAGFVIPLILHFCFRLNLMDYLSPFCVLESVCLLLLCAKIKVTSPITQKILAFLSTYSLGIYLFQAQPVIWNRVFVQNIVTPENTFQIIWMFAALSFGIFIPGIIIYFVVCKICSFRIFNSIRDYICVVAEKFYTFIEKYR